MSSALPHNNGRQRHKLAGPFRANNGPDAPYSITSSAVASSEGGTVRPKAFGLQVYANLKRVGCSTGIGELRSRDEVVSVVDC